MKKLTEWWSIKGELDHLVRSLCQCPKSTQIVKYLHTGHLFSEILA